MFRIALIVMLAIVVSILPSSAASLLGDDQDEGMSIEEMREYVIELIKQILSEARYEPPIVDPGASPAVVAHIRTKLNFQQVTVHFEETPFDEAFDFLRDITGLNIVFSPSVSESVESGDLRLNLRLKDIALKHCLALMLEADKEFTYCIKFDVLYIETRDNVKVPDLSYILQFLPLDEILYDPPDFEAPDVALTSYKRN